MNAKYCKNNHPVNGKWICGHSPCWKKRNQVKECTEDNMLWKVNIGNERLWLNNKTGMGDIVYIITIDDIPPLQTVKDINILNGHLG